MDTFINHVTMSTLYTQISPNFWKHEFEYSHFAKEHNINNVMNNQDLVYATLLAWEVLEPWRQLAGNTPFRANSLYRSYDLNRLIGGSPNSAHMSARAVDKGLGDHKKRYRTLDNMYEELIASDIQYDKAIIETNLKGNRWIHVQIAKIWESPRLLKLIAIEDATGAMQYHEYT